MKKVLSLILFVNCLFAQQSQTLFYKVQTGETLYAISKKFNVSVDEITQANSQIENNTLSIGQEIIIPQKKATSVSNNSSNEKKTHNVQAQETLFSIARTYTVSVGDLENLNIDILKDGLKIGQLISIPNKVKTLDGRARIINDETIFHKVVLGETKYSISKKYGIAIEQLEKQNPETINNLIEGNVLAINKSVINPKNDSDELMIVLAEKQVEIEKNKANQKKVEDLEDKLFVQKEMNQKILKLNSLDVDLREIDETKGGSVERLKLVMEANKSIQDILALKLDSLVNTMEYDLDALKKKDIQDLALIRKLEKENNLKSIETNKLIFQLKKDLSESRTNFTTITRKIQYIDHQQSNELKAKNRKATYNEKDISSLNEMKKIQIDQDKLVNYNALMFSKADSIAALKDHEIKRRISKATFYSSTAREFDDKVSLQKLKRYVENIKNSKNKPVSSNVLVTNEKVIQSTVINFNNLYQMDEGVYFVVEIEKDQTKRDEFCEKLIDSQFYNTSFFYNKNDFSYYIYTHYFVTMKEAINVLKLSNESHYFPVLKMVELIHL